MRVFQQLFESELVLYHKTAGDFDRFKPYSHFGTARQAEMRGVSGNGVHTRRVSVSGTKWKRMKDTGSWDERALWEEFEAAWAKYGDLDRLSDTQFKKACPSAEDSYIVFDPYRIKPATNLREWDEEDFEEPEQWIPETFVLSKGTRLYHGTSGKFADRMGLNAPAWVTDEQSAAEFFRTWNGQSGPSRIIVYEAACDLHLAQINDRHELSEVSMLVSGHDEVCSTISVMISPSVKSKAWNGEMTDSWCESNPWFDFTNEVTLGTYFA